jgi:Fur family zinc uptake transcriptional regulator
MRSGNGLPRNQSLVLDALRASSGTALTAYELLARLGGAGLRGPQTIYRALDSLQQAGLVHRIESINAFSACNHDGLGAGAHASRHRPAFAVCRRCHVVRELDDAALSAVLGVVADRSGFSDCESVIELVGTCPSCDATESGSAG